MVAHAFSRVDGERSLTPCDRLLCAFFRRCCGGFVFFSVRDGRERGRRYFEVWKGFELWVVGREEHCILKRALVKLG